MTQRIQVTCNDDQYPKIVADAESLGLSPNQYLRMLAMREHAAQSIIKSAISEDMPLPPQ